jgi:hypothetical protein
MALLLALYTGRGLKIKKHVFIFSSFASTHVDLTKYSRTCGPPLDLPTRSRNKPKEGLQIGLNSETGSLDTTVCRAFNLNQSSR